MMQEQAAVARFMRDVKGLELPERPTLTTVEIRRLCDSLIREEAEETSVALRLAPASEDPVDALVEIADGLADTLYVVLYTANALGIDLEPIFNEVQRSNMTKLGGEKRTDGKQLKPASYEPPKLRPLIEAQIS
jgi:NTP pyrophosphatase (non-canonical NTP hydrolase)